MPVISSTTEPIILDDSFVEAAKRVDLSKDGIHLIGQDITGVSYYAEVKGNKIVGYSCKDLLGAQIPSFVVSDLRVINGVQLSGADELQCLCCHRHGGGVHCHPIACP